jgi:crossover junction endodeoxyribonuclease RuvC
MIYLGIDPGKSGGIAAIHDGSRIIHVWKMPATERDLLDLLAPYNQVPIVVRDPLERPGPGVIAMIEQVGVMPKQGIVSAFTFGKNVGALHMALAAARIPYDQVLPAKWQLVLGCRSGGDKNVTKRRAQQLFPTLTVTHAIADALLIAEYARRLHRGIHGKEEDRAAQAPTQAAGTRLRPDGWTEDEARSLRAHGLDPDQVVVRRATQNQDFSPTSGPAVAGPPRARAAAQRAPR